MSLLSPGRSRVVNTARNYTLEGEPQKYNNNRQIVSSVEAIEK
ncbi:WavE lipopolysaccharide synthesis family protein [Vibrio chagasii]|nr:WavE lipopolysaccharide synthesis family protein [Vibrio chagasii]